MTNRVYALHGVPVMDVEVDGVMQTRPVYLEAYGSKLTRSGAVPLTLPKPETRSGERLLEEINGTFRIITVAHE